MNLHLIADEIKVDDDEGRFVLIIDTDEGDKVTVNIHACVFDFYRAVQANVRPYVLEAESARASAPTIYTDAYNEAHGEPDYDLMRDMRRGK